MPPIESQNQMALTQATTPGGAGGGPGASNTVSLSMLIEFLLQKTYHEITVLAELLPRKTDMERKIEIVQFASRTRQQFVRLLALVKWANSAAKVDKCGTISNFLDQQAMLFVDTADQLARMAREVLVNARLPNFSIPHAVDVLTTGTFPRLPACIKEKIIPPDPITADEKAATLSRLNQILQHRLVTIDLPPQLANLTIKDGRVKFHVPHEFEATLTVMGDDPTIPWRLLSIEVLVQDPETGDGKALVHSVQVNYIHQLIQSRLFDDDKQLLDLYNCLHSFCQSLQLEVLHSQAQRLIRERWGEHLMISKYTAGQNLTLDYWRAQNYHADKFKRETYTLTVCIDQHDSCKPLQVQHHPVMSSDESKLADQAIKCDQLSIEKLLVQTVQVRSKVKLQELKSVFETDLSELIVYLDGKTPVLTIAVLQPCARSEMLCISLDLQTGTLQPSLPYCEGALLEDLEQSLNTDLSHLDELIIKIRFRLGLERCYRTISSLPCHWTKKLPLLPVSEDHPLMKLSENKVYIQFTRYPNYYLLVELQQSGGHAELYYKYHLLFVRQATYQESTAVSHIDTDTSEHYLQPISLIPVNPHSTTHGPDTYLHDNNIISGRKRKHTAHGLSERLSKLLRSSDDIPYFLPELAHTVAMCDARIPFIGLCDELALFNLCHQGVQVEGEGLGLCVKIVNMPVCEGIPCEINDMLSKSVLDCSIRLQGKTNKTWLVHFIFSDCPLNSSYGNHREQADVRHIYLQYDSFSGQTYTPVIQQLVQDWQAIGQLYVLAADLATAIQDPTFSAIVEVRSYTYRKLTLAYGRDKSNIVTIHWQPSDGRFHLSVGVVGPSSLANCHSFVLAQLEQELNQHGNLPYLVQVLNDTQSPLQAICKLQMSPMLGLQTRPLAPWQTFSILPQSSTHIRIAFRSIYCLDIQCKGKNMIAIRDGAYSLFDISKVVEAFTPTPGLKSFLTLFVDDSVTHPRRRSISEDDDPPSPIRLDTIETIMTQVSTASPISRAGGFAHPMTPPSNPATPASPHGSVVSQGQQYGSSPGASAYPLASPPSISSGITPSPMIGTPSPGNLLMASSPSSAVHVPSPSSFVHNASPSPFIGHTGLEGGSPYPNIGITMPSPGTRNWPGSPSLPGPSPVARLGMVHSPGNPMMHSPGGATSLLPAALTSPPFRILPQRSWAASIPTLLSHEALHSLFTPSPPPGVIGGPSSYMCCPMERFLGSVFMKRHLHRVIQTDDSLQSATSNEPGVIQFNVESLQCRVSLNPNTLQTLHLKLTPKPDTKENWSQEELQVLEKFFETKVVCPPFKANALTAFGRLLGAPSVILKDCVNIMRLEMVPDRTLKWTVQWCLSIPPSAPPIAPPGTPAVVIKNKVLFFIQLTRIGVNLAAGTEPQTIVVPIIYDIQSNTTQQTDVALRNSPTPPVATAVSNMLRRFAEMNPHSSDCTIFAAVRELMANLVIPH
ncbi:mediator of RNA polymerase II transcription subunit 14-like isoform X2 [Ptychodera flava]|uniref:mediator of RNA polymerase II transcription subunit 14-like isoform X2 n=1 Tax=Ptychodera flava TaxID=63121 RepID=UPI00396AAD14